MNALRYAVFLASLVGAAVVGRAVDRVGPEPSEIIYPHAAHAATTTTGGLAGQIVPTPSVSGSLPALGYVVVLVVMLAAAWMILKRGSLPRPFNKGEGRLKVLETRMLGNRQFLVVVEYDDARMMLGVCQGRIDYLTPLAGHPLATAAAEAAMDETEYEPEITRIPATPAGGRH